MNPEVCYHLSLSWARWIQSMPFHPNYLWSILILSSHLHLGLASGRLWKFSPPQHVMHFSSPLTCHTSCPSHPHWYDDSSNILWAAPIVKLPLWNFLNFLVSFSLSGPNISPSPLFLNSHSLCSSVSVRHEGSHPHKRRKSCRYVYFILCVFGCRTGKQKVLDQMVVGILWILSLLVFSYVQFWFVGAILKYLNIATFSEDLLAILKLRFASQFTSW